MKCLHCEISEVMMRRQAAGEKVGVEAVGKIIEVIADIAASQRPQDRESVFKVAALFLEKFAPDVISGAHTARSQIIDPNGVAVRRH